MKQFQNILKHTLVKVYEIYKIKITYFKFYTSIYFKCRKADVLQQYSRSFQLVMGNTENLVVNVDITLDKYYVGKWDKSESIMITDPVMSCIRFFEVLRVTSRVLNYNLKVTKRWTT